jgi:hypothetical protein
MGHGLIGDHAADGADRQHSDRDGGQPLGLALATLEAAIDGGAGVHASGFRGSVAAGRGEFGGSHRFPPDIFVVSGRLTDR